MPRGVELVNNGAAQIDDQIRRLREIFGARNDSDLAAKLSVTRFAVSKWRTKGVIPTEYRVLIERPINQTLDYTLQFIQQRRIYAHADNHYWLRAALHFLPVGYGDQSSTSGRAQLLDFVLTRLMDAAADATTDKLGKPRCEGEADFKALLGVLASHYGERIQRVLAEGLPKSPQ
jgi:hypothetical protein